MFGRQILGIVVALAMASVFIAGCDTTPSSMNNQPDNCVMFVERFNLTAITDTSEISGKMGGIYILAIGGVAGTVNTDDYYKFYYVLPDGGIKQNKIKVGDATIYERNQSGGYIEHFVQVMKGNGNSCDYQGTVPYSDFYRIYVPTGSVDRTYELGLGK